MKRIVRIIGLLLALFVLLSVFPKVRFCIAGISAYFTIGTAFVLITWGIAYRILSHSAIRWRVTGVIITVIASFSIWLTVMVVRGFHLICW